jgi:hypothetical protein
VKKHYQGRLPLTPRGRRHVNGVATHPAAENHGLPVIPGLERLGTNRPPKQDSQQNNE